MKGLENRKNYKSQIGNIFEINEERWDMAENVNKHMIFILIS